MAKKKTGRKPAPEGTERDVIVSVRFTAAEAEAVKAAAAGEDRSVSHYVRRAALAAVEAAKGRK